MKPIVVASFIPAADLRRLGEEVGAVDETGVRGGRLVPPGLEH